MEFSSIAELAVGGIPVAIFVLAVVEALKWSGLLKTSSAQRVAVLATSVVGAATWAAVDLYPELRPAATVLFTAVVGAALSTLAYSGLSRAFNRNRE